MDPMAISTKGNFTHSSLQPKSFTQPQRNSCTPMGWLSGMMPSWMKSWKLSNRVRSKALNSSCMKGTWPSFHSLSTAVTSMMMPKRM